MVNKIKILDSVWCDGMDGYDSCQTRNDPVNNSVHTKKAFVRFHTVVCSGRKLVLSLKLLAVLSNRLLPDPLCSILR